MREFIVLNAFEQPVKVVWNPDAVTLTFDALAPNESKLEHFDGKEALKLISFIQSL